MSTHDRSLRWTSGEDLTHCRELGGFTGLCGSRAIGVDKQVFVLFFVSGEIWYFNVFLYEYYVKKWGNGVGSLQGNGMLSVFFKMYPKILIILERIEVWNAGCGIFSAVWGMSLMWALFQGWDFLLLMIWSPGSLLLGEISEIGRFWSGDWSFFLEEVTWIT